jgi:hypothetical protein
MTQMQEKQQGDNLPTFAHIWKLTTIAERNDKGSWMGWNIEHDGKVAEQEHYDAALSFYKALGSGAVKMRTDQTHGPSED